MLQIASFGVHRVDSGVGRFSAGGALLGQNLIGAQ